ncbi:MAG: hypothetical protein WCW34_03220 [Patescibacteria group bacterium]|jgi:hypothetical protein
MSTLHIDDGVVELKLTSPRSKVRICDDNGNHVSKPSTENINFGNHCIEWMITNNELLEIVRQKFIREEVAELRNKLLGIDISLKNSEFYSRAAQKQNINQTIGNFIIYKYEEVFYSFEKNIDTNLQVKITFKMGDYTLAAHMFVLIGLTNSSITLKNHEGNIENVNILGSGAKCFWSPSNQTISEIAKALACSSEDHKDDLISLLGGIST